MKGVVTMIVQTWETDLHQYVEKWNEGFQTFDAAPIKAFYHDEFVGYWGNSKLVVPDQYDKHYDLEQTLRGMPGAVKEFNILHSAKRADNEVAVIGTWTAHFDGQNYPSQCIYIWRHTESGWKLLREYIELER